MQIYFPELWLYCWYCMLTSLDRIWREIKLVKSCEVVRRGSLPEYWLILSMLQWSGWGRWYSPRMDGENVGFCNFCRLLWMCWKSRLSLKVCFPHWGRKMSDVWHWCNKPTNPFYGDTFVCVSDVVHRRHTQQYLPQNMLWNRVYIWQLWALRIVYFESFWYI